jgi:uncharacterized protein
VRAVLDPNVVISGVLSRTGAPAAVLGAWELGEFELVASPALIAELERAFSYPKLRKYLPEEDADEIVRWLAGSAVVVPDPANPPAVRSKDPGDDYLIALAASERALLVSGDGHLLDLREQIPVYSPREFLKLLDPQSPRGRE